MHDSPGAGPRGRFNHVADHGRIHRTIGGRRDPGLTVNGGDVINDVDISERRFDRGPIAKISDRDLEARSFQIARPVAVAHQDANSVPVSQQAAGQMAPGKPGCPGD